MTNSEDREWVESGLKHWREQQVKHPRCKTVQFNVECFELWNNQLDLKK